MKVTTRSVFRRCGCRSAGECNHNVTAPIEALEILVDKFAAEIKEKLIRKLMRDNYSGWDNDDFTIEKIKNALIVHVEKGDPVDIAAFAAFWWNKIG